MKNRKLTKSIRKLILLLLVLVVLFPVLSGCQSSTPPSQESSYAPLSDAKITEIKKAWETQWIDSYGSNCPFKWDLTSEVYYFGTHGNCIAILDIHLEDGMVGNNGMSYEVAGVTIYSLYDYYFFIYRNGTFVWLKEAYEKGWVTKEHIISMAERLKNQYPDKVEVIIQESSYAPLSDAKIDEIKKAWEANPLDNCSKDRHYLWDLRSEEYYYGTHGDCIVIFDMAKDYDLCASGTLRIADVRLNSQYCALVVVYRNGEFMHIIDAYNNGWLTIEQIHSIAEYHGSIPGRSWEEAE